MITNSPTTSRTSAIIMPTTFHTLFDKADTPREKELVEAG